MIAAPRNEAELLDRARALAGLRLGALARELGSPLPPKTASAKGWAGAMLEVALGATAGNLPQPDFEGLGVELKSIPIDDRGLPRESTYVCRAPSVVAPGATWAQSVVWRKLRRVLWLPIEAAGPIPLTERRIGWAFLWSPTAHEAAQFGADWEELTGLLATGRRAEISARLGTLLQLRPKAADARERAPALDESGAPGRALPCGFYLRARFTRGLLSRQGGATPAT